MREYLHREHARALVTRSPEQFIGDANETPVTDLFAKAGVEGINMRPLELYTSKYPILEHLGSRALRVLDIAPSYEPLGLYIASQGHSVTAIDISDGAVAWQNYAAERIGLDNFEAHYGDVLELDDKPGYDVVIAGMLLHFMDRQKAEQAVGRIQGATSSDGLNAVSVYTNDNPVQEKTRGLVNMYDSVDDLVSMYSGAQWKEVEKYEGPRAHAVDRGYLVGKSMVLLPTIAEVIMKKLPNGMPVPDFSDISDFEKYVLD